MTTTLALDLGSITGFAWKPAHGVIVSGSIDFRPKRYEGGGMRYLRFREQLNTWRVNCGVSRIFFEEVRRHIGTDAAHVYGGFMATLMAWCEEHEVPCQGVPVGTIKKFWTGKGNAKKDAMIAEAAARGFDVADDNEADALALLHCKLVEGGYGK